MNERPRHAASALSKGDIPQAPGVYAWYRDGAAVYAGRAVGADGLQGRIWSNHLGTRPDLSRSSFRRNVCEHLGIASTERTRIRPTVMAPADVQPVNEWIRACEVAWVACESDDEAKRLEKALLAEWLPPLSKR